MSPLDHSAASDKYAWISDANCVKHPKLYRQLEGFHGSAISKQALELCETCPVRVQCINSAYEHSAEFGYMGGLSPTKRRELKSAENAIQWLREQGRLPEQ